MLTLLKSKLAMTVLGLVVAMGAAGTATVVAAQQHVGPFAQSSGLASGHSTGQGTTTPQGSHQFHAQGLIQGVTLNSDTVSGMVLFLPDGASKAVTVHFTAQTHVEVADDAQQGSSTSDHGQIGAAGLKTGEYALVVGTLQSDGTVLATEIQANTNGKAHQGGATPTPGSGEGHRPIPTPGSDDGHRPTPTPHAGN
jgi:cytochrome c-type biogenesis protein CcmE